MPANPRSVALAVILQVLEQGQNLDQSLNQQLGDLDDPRDRGLAQRLAYGVLRSLTALESLLKQLLNRPVRAKDRDIYYLLLLGLEQLWLESIPEHAVIFETGQVARHQRKPWAVALVNGVLRNFQRNRETLLGQLHTDPVAQYSHPQWLLSRMQQDWPEDWQELAHANNQPAPMWLRVNRGKATAAAYVEQHTDSLGPVTLCPFAADAICLSKPVPVESLPGFKDGVVSIQDPAAQLAAELLELAPGQRVLDACAAPGGKTAHILERQPDLGFVLAVDSSETRLQKLRDNLHRLELDCQILCADAGQPQSWWDSVPFDRILLDAPCSATGVIRRHPDIKWLRRNSDIARLADQQLQMLNSLWPLLKPGGMLVYATCSILAAENHELLNRFIGETTDLEVMPHDGRYGVSGNPGIQLLPHLDAADGFFYAQIRKQP
jgi:16S rRNA (cytosine967-C5)-methyltransferase